jgi:hypothetical protein
MFHPHHLQGNVLISHPAKELPALKGMPFNLIADEIKFRSYITEKSSIGFGLKATNVKLAFSLQRKGSLNYVSEIVCLNYDENLTNECKPIQQYSRML